MIYLHESKLANPDVDLVSQCGLATTCMYAASGLYAHIPSATPTYDEARATIEDTNRNTAYLKSSRCRRRFLHTYGAAWNQNCFVAREHDFGPYDPPLEVLLAHWALTKMSGVSRREYLLTYSSRPPCDYPDGSDETNYCSTILRDVFRGRLNRAKLDLSSQVLYISSEDVNNQLLFDWAGDETFRLPLSGTVDLEQLRHIPEGM